MKPLVYAPEKLVAETAPLLKGAVLENAISEAIARGDVEANKKGGIVFLDDHELVARVERRPGKVRTSGPRAWWVTGVEPNRNANRRRSRADDKIAQGQARPRR